MSDHKFKNWEGISKVTGVKVFDTASHTEIPRRDWDGLEQYLPDLRQSIDFIVARYANTNTSGNPSQFLTLLLNAEWNGELALKMGRLKFKESTTGDMSLLLSTANLNFKAADWNSVGKVELSFYSVQKGKIMARIDFRKESLAQVKSKTKSKKTAKKNVKNYSAYWCW